MSSIAIVTDTNSSITNDQAKKLGIYLIPMPVIIDDEEYFEGVNCGYEQFFEKLHNGSEVSTSQPSPETVTGVWDEALKDHDYVIHIPMSSALSGSMQSAKALALDYNGKVLVADNKRISPTQCNSVTDALTLIKKGLGAEEIVKRLEENSLNSSIYLAVNTLELLKKSGRVTAAGAAIATVLGIKPVLQIQGGRLDAFAKVRGMENAEKTMINAAKKDIETRFKGKNIAVDLAYSGDIKIAEKWLEKIKGEFPDREIKLYRLPLSICCHVADGVKAIALSEIEE